MSNKLTIIIVNLAGKVCEVAHRFDYGLAETVMKITVLKSIFVIILYLPGWLQIYQTHD